MTATFHQRVYGLSVAAGTPPGTVGQGSIGTVIGIGGGAGSLSCGIGGGICSAGVDHGTHVFLLAIPAPGDRFMSWVGAPCAGRSARSFSSARAQYGSSEGWSSGMPYGA